jgi:hypothetical protein
MIVYSCSNRLLPPDSSRPGERKATSQRKADDPVEAGYLGYTKQQEAWHAFAKEGRYRWARPEDFSIPGWATARSDAAVRSRMWPIEGGDINHDGAYNDFAVIVVDTTRTEPDRFGLVIFNEPGDGDQPYSLHWVLRNVDLSATALDWSSDGLGVTRYEEDGYSWQCNVKWNQSTREYSCNMKRVSRRW